MSTTSPETGLPPSWEVRLSQSRHLPYYFNTQTKVSHWEPPPGTDASLLKAYMAAHHSQSLQQPPQAQPGIGAEGGGTEDKIRAAHILVKHEGSRRPSSWKEERITRSKDEALEVLKGYEERIKAGEVSLGDLAATESDCSSARKKGDLGFFGRREMQKEFEDVAFALKPGEVSGIVSTVSGLHLIERLQ
ncbi:MAG: hypothetical protein Q9163_001770 [Psora crenata]